MSICKTIIPAAGLGTRFLPTTKAIAKEMLPILDKPALQYVLEEGIASHIEHFILIINRYKSSIMHYFDHNQELSMILKEHKKEKLLDSINAIIKQATFTYINQPEALGLGHAILLAKHTIGKEYFSVCLPDDIITTTHQPGLAQLIAIAQQEKGSVIAIQEVPLDKIASYGVISIKKQITPSLYQVNGLVEKPKPEDAPSNLAIVGRYVLSYKIFDSLTYLLPYSQNELQLTDGINHMLKQGERVFAYKIQGRRYDTGTPLGLLKANIGIGLHHPVYGPELQKLFEKNLVDAITGQW